jgi:hypothetical protein
VGSRFGSGNLYATVAIPGTAIVPGMELVTEADLNAYTANSIIFEAPDFGFVVAPAGQNGGTASIQARARTIPGDTQCAPVTSQVQSADVEFSRTVRIEILPAQTVITRVAGGVDVSVTAQISGNFDPAVNTVVRWGFDGNSVDIVVDMPDMTPPGAPRLLTQVFHLPMTKSASSQKLPRWRAPWVTCHCSFFLRSIPFSSSHLRRSISSPLEAAAQPSKTRNQCW